MVSVLTSYFFPRYKEPKQDMDLNYRTNFDRPEMLPHFKGN